MATLFNKRNLVTILAVTIFLFLIFFYFWLDNRGRSFEKSFFALDTLVTVRIYDLFSEAKNEKDVTQVINFLKRFEKTVNYFDPESELSRLNDAISRGDALSGYPVSETLEKLLILSLEMSEMSGGKFDFTVGRLITIWDFAHGGRIPAQEEIKEALRHTSYKKVFVSNGKVFAPPGVSIDLGAIAKGYAIDVAGSLLRKKGHRDFLINSVSSTLVNGSKNGENFQVGIENPRGQGLIAVIRTRSGETVSTTGDYQKFFEVDGKRYHHVLDPVTGYPAGGLASVTVVSKRSAAETDALSTAIFVMGEKEGLQFARKNRLKVIMITPEKEIYIYPEGDWVKIVK